MATYEKALRELGEAVLTQLQGPGGLLVITETRLVLIQEAQVQALPLKGIRRVGRGEGGVVVQAEEGSLTIPLKAFPLEELKGFLEGLKPHVARARKAAQVPPPPPKPVWEEETPPPQRTPSVELAPEPPSPAPEPAPKARPTWEEEAPSPKEPLAPPIRRRNPLALPLRLLALLTLAYTGAFLALNPGADLWTQLGTALFGLTLALTAWSSATSFSSSS